MRDFMTISGLNYLTSLLVSINPDWKLITFLNYNPITVTNAERNSIHTSFPGWKVNYALFYRWSDQPTVQSQCSQRMLCGMWTPILYAVHMTEMKKRDKKVWHRMTSTVRKLHILSLDIFIALHSFNLTPGCDKNFMKCLSKMLWTTTKK